MREWKPTAVGNTELPPLNADDMEVVSRSLMRTRAEDTIEREMLIQIAAALWQVAAEIAKLKDCKIDERGWCSVHEGECEVSAS